LWDRKNLGTFENGYTGELIQPHGSRLLKVTPKNGTVTVNDDDLSMRYDGSWVRNDGLEVAQTSQPVVIDVTESTYGAPQELTEQMSARTVTINNDDPGIRYTGRWNHSGGRGFGDYMDDVQWTETEGDYFEYTFVGTGIQYVTEIDPSQGEVDIYIDDEFMGTVDTYSDQRMAQQTVYAIDGLPNGTHTLKAVKKSSGRFMLLDKLVVTLETLVTPDTATFDKNEAAQKDVTFTLLPDASRLASVTKDGVALTAGTDYTISGQTVTINKAYLANEPVGETTLLFTFSGDYLNDIHATANDGDSITFTFNGTGFNWITAKAPDQGLVDIYVDGVLRQTVDTYHEKRLTVQTVFSISDLKYGEHTFKAVKRSGTYMRADAIQYKAK
jgi:alpha-galactosidase